MPDTNIIKDYILFLRKECNLSVTLHISPEHFEKVPKPLIPFNIHDNPYCICIKEKAHFHCVECQKKVAKKVENGEYTGVCHAGVKEFVYPVSDMEKCVGFISVGGYKCENSESHINRISEKYEIPLNKLRLAYSQLKEAIPDKKRVDTLIFPLIAMLKLCLQKAVKTNKNDTFAEKIKSYLLENRNENIKSNDICRHFGCSRSYISREFNKCTGKTIREYLTELRIADAKILLKSSNLTITEIAFTVGFGDSNYFSNLFKNQVGLTPKEYRHKNY